MPHHSVETRRNATVWTADGETEAPISNATSCSDRRERKRQTDRVAQQQHRKRQKKYVEELEAKLRVLQSSDESEVVRLGNENFQLRQTLKSLNELWGEMEVLFRRHKELVQETNLPDLIATPVTKEHSNDHNGNGRDPDAPTGVGIAMVTNNWEVEADDPRTIEPPTTGTVITPEDHAAPHAVTNRSSGSQGSLATFSEPPSLFSGMQLEMGDATGNLGDFDPTHTARDAIVDDWPSALWTMNDDWLTGIEPSHQNVRTNTHHPKKKSRQRGPPQHSSSGEEGPGAEDVHRGRDKSRQVAVPSRPQPMEQNLNHSHTDQAVSSDSQTFPQWLEAFMFESIPGILNPRWLSSEFSCGGSSGRPLIPLSPASKEDETVIDMIERARASIDHIGPPDLMEFLLDNPKNTLSVDLKKFLEPVRKSKGTSEFLATYWVLYLLLRWHILQTDDTYQSLPQWLRPTPIQLSVLHPVGADLIAWPGIREAVISTFASDSRSIHRVALDIGTHLKVYIDTSRLDFTTGPTGIASQITNLSNWSLDDGFYDRYPQWKGILS